MKTFLLLLLLVLVSCGLLQFNQATICDTVDAKQDLLVLNYALSLEHLEYAFYRDGLSAFSQSNVANFSNVDYSYLVLIRDHERDHVGNLSQVIQSFNGVPVQECTYEFGYGSDFATFLSIARTLENTGVSAYTGAIANITNKVLLTASATIATVEARHASYLNLVNRGIPFPDSFDTPVSMMDILAVLNTTGFIRSCPAQNTECFGMGMTANGVCSGNGACMGANICKCNRGFKGAMCNETCDTSCSACQSPSQCCNDIRLGSICFNTTTHQCVPNGENNVLCAVNEQVCNNFCYDTNLFQCSNGFLVPNTNRPANPQSEVMKMKRRQYFERKLTK